MSSEVIELETVKPNRLGLSKIPEYVPGVYVFKDINGDALYIGASIRLGYRVKQQLRTRSFSKLGSVSEVSFKVLRSVEELEPFESDLISQLNPKYNIRVRGGRWSIGRPSPGGYSPQVVQFVSKCTSLNRAKDQWAISLPPTVREILDTRRIFQVTLMPLGTIR